MLSSHFGSPLDTVIFQPEVRMGTQRLTLIPPLFFALKMLSACNVCFILRTRFYHTVKPVLSGIKNRQNKGLKDKW